MKSGKPTLTFPNGYVACKKKLGPTSENLNNNEIVKPAQTFTNGYVIWAKFGPTSGY